MLLVVGRAPPDPATRAAAAAATGVPLPDFVRRLTGPMPRVVHSSTDGAATARAAEALRALGYGAITVDPTQVRDDSRRLVVRSLVFGEDALVVTEPTGATETVRWTAVALIQRAVRSAVEVDVTVTKRKEISLSRSLMSGGLVNRKTVEEKHTTRTEAREAFLLLNRGDGGRDLVLSEKRVDFRFLGAEMAVVGFANLERTLGWLKRRLPGVLVDDRAARPGFVAGLGTWGADPTDLGVELVWRCFEAGVS